MIEIEDRVFTALADATRRRLLTRLAQSSPKMATQLAREFPISRQGIVKHLDLLAHAGNEISMEPACSTTAFFQAASSAT